MALNILDECGIHDILAGGTPPLPVFYHRNGAPKSIVDLVGLSNKRFGTDMETLVCRMTGCQKIPDKKGETGWDCEHLSTNSFSEIKSSRYWQGTKDFKWQHVLADHEWSHLILAAVDFGEIKLFMLTKDEFMNLMEKGIVTQQGGAGGQGCWFEYKKSKSFLHPITGNTLTELHTCVTELFQQFPCSREPKTKVQIDEALAKGRSVNEAIKQEKAAIVAAKKATASAEKKKKAAEREAKKAAKAAEKKKKVAERQAKKAAKEAEKKKKAAAKAAKKASKKKK